MIERWFNVFTYRRGEWISTFIPAERHLWDLLVAYRRHRDIVTLPGATTCFRSK